MQNPIQTEDDLLVFLDLMLENTQQTIENHTQQEMSHYLDRWHYIQQYALNNPTTQSAILIAELKPMISKAIEGISHLYELVAHEQYVAPQQRPTEETFSTSNFLRRLATHRDNQADPQPPTPNRS